MVQQGYGDPPDETGGESGLSEAQIAAIEGAFAEHERMLARLRRDVEEMRSAPAEPEDDGGPTARIAALEARIDKQEQALRHVLERLIGFFERERGS